MKFALKMNEFKQWFGLAAKSASPVETTVFSNVKITAQEGGENQDFGTVLFTATDTEIDVIARAYVAEVSEPGEVLLPIRLFNRILNANKASDGIELETSDDNTLIIRVGGAVYQIPVQSSADYPAIEPNIKTDSWLIESGEIEKAFNCTSFSVDTENVKYSLGGVLFDPNEFDEIDFVSTDGRRLSRLTAKAEVVGNPTPPANAIIPPKAFALARQIASMTGEKASIFTENGKIYFNFLSVNLSSRLIDGRFPAWRKIMPDVNERKYQTFNVESLLTAVRQAAALTTDITPGIYFQFVSDKPLTICVPESPSGKVSQTVQCVADETQPVDSSCKLDPNLIIPYLSALPSASNVTLWIGKEQSSVMFESLDMSEVVSKYVLMPLA